VVVQSLIVSQQAYSRVGVGILLREWVARWKSAVLAAQNKKVHHIHRYYKDKLKKHTQTMIMHHIYHFLKKPSRQGALDFDYAI
jgi:hypothetical protein